MHAVMPVCVCVRRFFRTVRISDTVNKLMVCRGPVMDGQLKCSVYTMEIHVTHTIRTRVNKTGSV